MLSGRGKSSSKWVVMCLDFAENYVCRHQDEAQSAHWTYEQVTLHPIVAYHRCQKEDCDEVMHHSLVFVPEDHKQVPTIDPTPADVQGDIPETAEDLVNISGMSALIDADVVIEEMNASSSLDVMLDSLSSKEITTSSPILKFRPGQFVKASLASDKRKTPKVAEIKEVSADNPPDL